MRAEINDETLREGLQSPSAVHPDPEAARGVLRALAGLGVDAVSLGLPAAGPVQRRAVEDLFRTLHRERLPLIPHCAARTCPEDLGKVADIQQAVGRPLTAYAFLGSSPVRRFAEGWTLEHLLSVLEAALRFAEREGVEVAFVTEDTTRSRPDELLALFELAFAHGVSRFVLCDTAGHATPRGAARLVRFVAERFPTVALDWHGHDDRGLAVANALAAAEAGAHRVHGTVGGAGERCGNTRLQALLAARARARVQTTQLGTVGLEAAVARALEPVGAAA